jgi:WD40 repeat protein
VQYVAKSQGIPKQTYTKIAELSFSAISSVAWSRDGSRLAIVVYPDVFMWDLPTKTLTKLITNAQVSSVSWSPDDKQLATMQGGEDETLSIWDSTSGSLLRQLSRKRPYRAYAYRAIWSPDGNLIASDSTALDVLIWNLADNSVISLVGHTNGRIGEITWSPDSKFLVSEGGDDTLRVWEVATKRNTYTIAHGGWMDWSPDGKNLAGSKSGDRIRWVLVWDAQTGQEKLKLDFGERVNSVRWNFAGALLAAAGQSNQIKIWNMQTGQISAEIELTSNTFTYLEWNPTRDLLVSHQDRQLIIWSAPTTD